MSRRITIVEVGPRDGLQNEKAQINTGQKIELIERLRRAGHRRIEVGALVNPQRIPQMGDSLEVIRQLRPAPGTQYMALVPNQQGFQAAQAAGVKAIAFFIGVTDSFNQKNIGTDTRAALQRLSDFAAAARKAKMFLRSYVSTAFGCPYEGEVKAMQVVRLCHALTDLGVQELSISDTIGVAVPQQVAKLTRRLFKDYSPRTIAMHFHDTRGTALANSYAAWQEGVTVFDASCGGLGGCPFAPNATGNVATEDLVYMFEKMGVSTGIDLAAQVETSRWLQQILGKQLPSRYLQSQRSVD